MGAQFRGNGGTGILSVHTSRPETAASNLYKGGDSSCPELTEAYLTPPAVLPATARWSTQTRKQDAHSLQLASDYNPVVSDGCPVHTSTMPARHAKLSEGWFTRMKAALRD